MGSRSVCGSVCLRDSVYREEATVVKERMRNRWHVRTDTIRSVRVDTVRAAMRSSSDRRETKRIAPLWTRVGLQLSLFAVLIAAAFFVALRFLHRR